MAERIKRIKTTGGAIDFVLFLAYIGAVVYFWIQATGFWSHVWAVIKAIAWPAILVYKGMHALGV